MKKIILTAACAAFVIGFSSAQADELAVKVVKNKLAEGCEYQKVPGKKKKQIVCVDEIEKGDASETTAAVDVTPEPPITPDPTPKDGKSGNDKGANNGIGNGNDGGTNPPGNSGKKFSSGSTDNR